MQQSQQQLAQQQLQQMQMQRQAIANAHNPSAGNVNSFNNPGSSNQGMNQGLGGQGMQYTPQQLAAAAQNAGLTSGNQGQQMNTGSMNTGGGVVPIRAYLDQTVIPILADGEFCASWLAS